MNSSLVSTRPVVFDYGATHLFLQDLLCYYKTTRSFSLREQSKTVQGCSQALVSQVLQGKRKVTRSNLSSLSRVFELTVHELRYIDEKLLLLSQAPTADTSRPVKSTKPVRAPKNHILALWHHVYIKDLIHLKGFLPQTPVIQRMLAGIVTPAQIQKSCEFLLREGFWRTTATKKLVVDDSLLVTTNDIPNERIRNLHKKALSIAMDGLEKFPIGTRRKSSTTLIAINQKSGAELRALMDSYHCGLQKFIEDHANDGPADELVQVTMHLTPIGVKNA